MRLGQTLTILVSSLALTEALLFATPLSAQQPVPTSHRLSATYAFYYFDEDNFDPWHLISVWGERKTSAVALIGRLNYARWFEQSEVQFEADAYPFFSRTLYGYLNLGYSPTAESFPEWRMGAELYANLPAAWEVSAGVRYLHWVSKDIPMLSGSLGKYYSAYWTSLRPFVAFDEGETSWALLLVTRRYLTDPNNYFSLMLVYGDAPSQAISEAEVDRSSDFKLELGGKLPLTAQVSWGVALGYEREELSADRIRNRIGVALTVERRF